MMKWYLLMWKGSHMAYIVEDRGSYIVWDEFGDIGLEKQKMLGKKIVDSFDSFRSALRFVENIVGSVEVVR